MLFNGYEQSQIDYNRIKVRKCRKSFRCNNKSLKMAVDSANTGICLLWLMVCFIVCTG